MKTDFKVFILTNTLLKGGAEKQSILLANTLSKDYPTTIIVYYGDFYDMSLIDLIDKASVSIVFLKGWHIKKIFNLFKLFIKNRNSVIFSYLATTNIINGVLGYLTKVKLRIGGIRNSKISYLKKIVQRFIHNHLLSATIFNNKNGFDNLIQQGFKANKSYVIPNYIDINKNTNEYKKKKNYVNILTVARFVKQKDYQTSIEAFNLLLDRLRNKNINVIYNIVGFGELEDKIRKWIREKNLTENIFITINPSNITNYFQQADIYLSTSIFEGLSNSIMEAMAHSLPVVATNVGDNGRLVQNGETGFLVTIKDVESIAFCLEKLVISNDLRYRMGIKGYKFISENYSEEKFKERYHNLLKALLNEA
jgi:glycosyltransferase involved in cell wall biosynthesis